MVLRSGSDNVLRGNPEGGKGSIPSIKEGRGGEGRMFVRNEEVGIDFARERDQVL